MAFINLPYGDNKFSTDSLKKYIKSTSRDYIIQGQVACKRVNHPKPHSLPILDKSLTANYKKIKFAEIEKATAPAEPEPEAPTAKKPKTVKRKRKSRNPREMDEIEELMLGLLE